MPNITQPWSFGGINNLPSTGRLSSDNNAEKAGQLPPLSAGRDIQVNHTKHIAAEEEEDSALTVATVCGCSDHEGNPRDTASVVKRQELGPDDMRYFSHGLGTGNMMWNLSAQLPLLVRELFDLSASLNHTSRGITRPNLGPENQLQPKCAPLDSDRVSNSQYSPLSVPSNLTPYGEFTTIILNTGKAFKIETDMLKHTSKYFASIYQNPESWPESRTGIVKLDGVDLATLDVYNYWLQTGSIEGTDNLVPDLALPPKADGAFSQGQNKLRPILVANHRRIYVKPIETDRLDQLVKCWIFADYIEAPAFQNDIMDALLSLYFWAYDEDCAFPLYNIPFIIKNTAAGVPLRAFIVDSVYKCLSGETLKKASTFKLIPKDLAIEVIVLAFEVEGRPHDVRFPPWDRNYCAWHVHPSGEAICDDPFAEDLEE